MDLSSSRNLLTPIDGVAVLLYLASVLWIGMRFSRRQSSADDYFVARKKIPGWAVGISMFASILSCFTFIAFPGWAYDDNWQILLKEMQMVTMVVFCGLLIIPIYRNVIHMSVFEYLEQRFGTFARLYCSFGTVISSPVGNGIILYVVCLALHSMTGWDLRGLILIIGLITFVYTLTGGVEGVVWTEVLQGLLFMGTGVVAVLYLLFAATPEGPAHILNVAWQGGKFDLFNWDPSLVRQTTWVMVLAGLSSAIAKFSRDPALVQRYLMAPTGGQAFKATLISTLCCGLTWTLFMLTGTLLWAYYQMNPGQLPPDITQGDKVFPYFIGSAMPHGVVGLVLAGLCASAMSGLAAGLNTTGAVVVSDFYLRFAKQPSQQHQLLISKLVVGVLGCISIAVALAVTLWQGGIMKLTLDLMAQLSALVLGGATGMFFLGLMTRRASKRGLYVAIACGFLFTLWAICSSNPASDRWLSDNLPGWQHLPKYRLHIWLLALWAELIVGFVGYIASVLLTPGYRAPRHLTIWRNGQDPAPSA